MPIVGQNKKLTEMEVARRLRDTLRTIYRDYPGSPENAAALIAALITVAATVSSMGYKKASDDEITKLASDMLDLAKDFMERHSND